MVERLFIAVDFDGTITRRDTLHVIVEAYGTKGLWSEIEPRLRAGEITIEEAMEEEFATVQAVEDEVIELVLREATVRPGFAELVDWARGGSHQVAVLSNGFRRVIDSVLDAVGLADLPIASNDAEFGSAGCRLVWAERGEACRHCGRRCKRRDLHALWGDERLVYIGDGISDRCVAPVAERIFARADLARDLSAAGIPFVPFEDFFDVLEHLRADIVSAA